MDRPVSDTKARKTAPTRESPPPVAVIWPLTQTAPLVVSSPHSGRFYPPDLIAHTQLDQTTLRRSEDSMVDALFAAAPDVGAPLIAATYARAYLDCNRGPYELEATMFRDGVPAFVDTQSPNVRTGFGTLPRCVAPGCDIYTKKLLFAEAERRIETIYRPYHRALGQAIERTRAAFPQTFVIDAHSMPSAGGRVGAPDFVLGDHFGAAAASEFVNEVDTFLQGRGYSVARNAPYAGGYITTHYGQPHTRCHVLQIEIDRGLYMDQRRMRESDGFTCLKSDIDALLAHLVRWTRRYAG